MDEIYAAANKKRKKKTVNNKNNKKRKLRITKKQLNKKTTTNNNNNNNNESDIFSSRFIKQLAQEHEIFTTKEDKKELNIKVARNLTQKQYARFKALRRSVFPKNVVKRIIINHSDVKAPSDKLAQVISTITKLFVGGLVEESRHIMNERNDIGPIRPIHLREAHRRMKRESKAPNVVYGKPKKILM